eukprot:1325960-Rhodomonas_salina.1
MHSQVTLRCRVTTIWAAGTRGPYSRPAFAMPLIRMGVCESRLDLPCCENRTEAGKLFPGDLYSLPRHIPEFRTRAYENHRPLPPQPSPRDSDLITLSTANGLVRVPEGSPEAQAIHWMQSPREKRGHIMEQGILSEHSHPLLLAARDGDLSILAQVLANGVSPNECDQVRLRSSCLEPCLHDDGFRVLALSFKSSALKTASFVSVRTHRAALRG